MRKILIMIAFSMILLMCCESNIELFKSEEEFYFDETDNITCKKIVYESDGIAINGYLVHPTDSETKLPVIIYNRGGMGKIGCNTDSIARSYFVELAKEGYVVLASNYRGSDNEQGIDQYGGEDINDVLNLIEVAKRIDFIDDKRMYMIGVSRGGLMTYLAIRDSNDIKAAAVISGISDFKKLYEARDENKQKDYVMAVGSTPEENEEEYVKRSAIYWAESITTPLLIMHGTNDNIVDVSQAYDMAYRLEELDREHKLIVYEGDNHGLFLNRRKVDKEILEWFKSH